MIIFKLSFLITSLSFSPHFVKQWFLFVITRSTCVGLLLSKGNSDWRTRINSGARIFTIAATYVMCVKCQ